MKTKIPFTKQLQDAGWNTYVDEDVLKTGPDQTGTIETFTVGKYLSDADLEKEYESRGLVPASPEQLVEYVHPDFKEKYLGTHWKDEDGNWCFAAFSRWGGDERGVSVHRGGSDWSDRWWFAGVRKSSVLETKPSLDPKSLEARVQALEEWKEKLMAVLQDNS